MKVLVIQNYEDAQQGQPTAVIRFHEGQNADDVGVAWLNKQPGYVGKSRENCLDAPYSWHVTEVLEQNLGE